MLKKFIFSVGYRPVFFDISMLILRLVFGILMIPHGYSKLMAFSERQEKFMSFLGLSPTISLMLVIFAEMFCAALVALGLFTRLALIPLIVACIIITFVAHNGELLGKGFQGFAYLSVYTVVFLLGPGKISLDYFIFRKK